MYKRYFNTGDWLRNRPKLSDYGISKKFVITLWGSYHPRSYATGSNNSSDNNYRRTWNYFKKKEERIIAVFYYRIS